MAGIYIHIPFCRKACHYCNFHFSTSHQSLPAVINAIIQEIEMRKDYLSEPVETIYFGGGTPSICHASDIERILQTIRNLFIVKENAEITLEANPDDISAEKAIQWKNSGINRLSIGIQSFHEEDLQWMNRAHSAAQAIESIKTVQQCGFHNITIDLIYGTPVLSDEQWERNVTTAIQLNIPHISCYALTVEPKTALDMMIRQKKKEDVNTDQQAIHFEKLMQWLNAAGYEHYEISNFAKPGYRSKHNSNYWKGVHYLGIGPSAHSFNGATRHWNVANNALYIQNMNDGILPSETEILTTLQQLNEYIMTSLRTIEGLSLLHVSDQFGKDKRAAILSAAGKWLSASHMILINETLQLTDSGKFLADGIAADIFFLEEN
ncbi:MAG: radical SAM family heme chaperone HemW [Bacteroidota bacterium]|nr:radical SAM family heme chaperone HemW [Bacteroidota bacterium]